jgi:hypothetical protein
MGLTSALAGLRQYGSHGPRAEPGLTGLVSRWMADQDIPTKSMCTGTRLFPHHTRSDSLVHYDQHDSRNNER